MSEPAWAQTLAVLYNKVEVIEIPLEVESMDRSHELVLNTHLEPEEVMSAIGFLDEMDLIELEKIPEDDAETNEYGRYSEYSHRELSIQKEGFDVAHDREQGLRQEGSSAAVAYLTGVLAVTALIEAGIAFTSTSGTSEVAIIGGMLIIASGIFLIAWHHLHKAGILDIEELRIRKQRFEKR